MYQASDLLSEKDDEERRQWSLHLYGIDTWDPNLYNMVLKIGKVTVDCAVDIVSNAVKQPCFQTTAESQQKLIDLALIAKLHTQIDKSLISGITATNNDLVIELNAPKKRQKELTSMINGIAEGIPDIKNVCITFRP